MNIRRRNWIRFLVIFTIFTVFFILLMDKVVMPWYTRQGQDFSLVNVRGYLFPEAREMLNRQGLSVEVIDSVKNTQFPPGTVIEQQPKPGHLVKQGRMIQVVISKGEDYFDMPNLVGKAYKAAQLELERYNLRIDTVYYRYSTDKPQEVIVEQSIPANKRVATNTAVELIVSKGPPPHQLQVPDLFGMSLEAAKQRIRQSGFRVGNIRFIPNAELTPYTVIDQTPAAGQKLDNPREINLEVTAAQNEAME